VGRAWINANLETTMRIAAIYGLAGLACVGCTQHQDVDESASSDSVDAGTREEIQTSYHRPVFSPDGEHVVFMKKSAETGDDWELFIANADGSNERRLTVHPGWDGYASFSPDGTMISFDRDDGEETRKRPMLMNLASGETTALGDFEDWLTVNSWSPDGILYAFWEKNGQRDIYALSADGAVITQITDTPEKSEQDIVVTPNGKSLIFAVEKKDGVSSIERIELSTGARETLVTSTGRAYGLSISPDGRDLAYTDDTPGGDDDDAEIYIRNLETGETRQMTDNGDWDHMPFYHPNGGYLLFSSYRTGVERIYRMALPGGEPGEFSPEG
jgi:TolB protein